MVYCAGLHADRFLLVNYEPNKLMDLIDYCVHYYLSSLPLPLVQGLIIILNLKNNMVKRWARKVKGYLISARLLFTSKPVYNFDNFTSHACNFKLIKVMN